MTGQYRRRAGEPVDVWFHGDPEPTGMSMTDWHREYARSTGTGWCTIPGGRALATIHRFELQTTFEPVPSPDVREALAAERTAIADEARRYASHYPQSSDGRNTFILLAEWIERRNESALARMGGGNGG